MNEIMRWLLEIQEFPTLVSIANTCRVTVPGFRIQKAPRKSIIEALLRGDIQKHKKGLFNTIYEDEDEDYPDEDYASLSIEELIERSNNHQDEIPMMLLTLIDNNKIDLAEQLFKDLRERGILDEYQRKESLIQEEQKSRSKSEPEDDYKKLYQDALKKIKVLEKSYKKLQDKLESAQRQSESERAESITKTELLEQKLENEKRRSHESIKNYNREKLAKEALEKEKSKLNQRILLLEQENEKSLKRIKEFEQRFAEQTAEVAAVSDISGIIVGNASLYKIAENSTYTLILENELTDAILSNVPHIILPLFACNAVTRRRVTKYAADRTLEFEKFNDLKNYLKGVRA